jgi:hypothetical protein
MSVGGMEQKPGGPGCQHCLRRSSKKLLAVDLFSLRRSCARISGQKVLQKLDGESAINEPNKFQQKEKK